MHDALAIAATGMQAHQQHLEAIANNLANVNTPVYKRVRVSFADMVTGARAGVDAAAGAGVALQAQARVFEPGELRRTEQPLDVAIQGPGFLEVMLPDASRAFVRGGSLKVLPDGQLATQDGLPLKPGLLVPDGAQQVQVGATGRVQARLPNQAQPVDLGQLELVRFAHPQGLVLSAPNTYRATDASGEPIGGRPGEEGLGTLVQGALEASNVKLVEEMLQLMLAQRSYEASVKVVQAADEMLGLVNGLRR